jgi:hypothetical protein
MRRLLRFSLLLIVAFTLFWPGDMSIAAQRASVETQTVYTTPDGFLLGPPVPGADATLVRNSRGLTTGVHTSVSSGPGVYSLWWIIYNDPASCTTFLCTFDLPDIAVNATARVVPDGSASLSAHLSPGGPYSGEVVLGDPSSGLTNPEGALVFLIVRYHGPATPGIIAEQLTQYAGGCPGAGAPCVDEQIIIFPGDCSGPCEVPFQ